MLEQPEPPSPEAPVLRKLELLAEETPLKLTVDDFIEIQAPDMGNHAIMLVRRAQDEPWHALLVPPGSVWELRAKPDPQPAAAPRLVGPTGDALDVPPAEA